MPALGSQPSCHCFSRSSVLLFVIAAILLSAGCTTRQPATPEAADRAVEPLLQLVRERLLIMHEVAKTKWNSHAPISDPARERSLVAELVAAGRQRGLDASLVAAFMTAQMEAGKQIQQADFRVWEAARQGPFADAVDLRTVIRPRIDRISQQMLERLAELAHRVDDPQIRAAVLRRAPTIITGDGIDGKVRETATAPLVY